MESRQGSLSIHSDNLFPIIKKWLYSDHDIFVRELVSNGCDAVTKLKKLALMGEYRTLENETYRIQVEVSPKEKSIRFLDNGVGMSAEEVEKYINQIAFSGVTDFLDKYKDNANAIIGHFGLGFYSAFMVSKKVEIITKSYKDDAKAVKWSCDGSPAYEIEDTEKAERGTDIVLYIDDDAKEFLETSKIESLLNKYCKFMAVPVVFGKKTEWKDGKQQETDEDNVINAVEPLWTKAPSSLKDEDYKSFYRTLYPMSDEPLFWIHLNVDYPFNLTGILYFPKIKSNIELQRNKIQLYSNQVFVTDQVDGIVPEFLTLLHGVIDSPDIPLNVSRSYLQSDANVKKISTYITKKVADRLAGIFKEDRKGYEEKWNDMKIFIEYGMLSQEDFYDKAKDFSLFTDVEGKNFTYEEYRTLIKDNQTDKDGTLIYLYATNKEDQYTYIEAAKQKGYSVLLFDGQLDVPMINLLEQKLEKCRFTRVDADIADKLIAKENQKESDVVGSDKDCLTYVFKSQMPAIDKTEFVVDVQALGEEGAPLMITQNEFMRRMKDMSQFQPGMGFYSQFPDSYTLVLNTDHPLIKDVLKSTQEATASELKPVLSEIKGQEARLQVLQQQQDKKKPEEVTSEEKADLEATRKAISDEQKKRDDIVAAYAKDNNVVHQLIDLALLQNGMLKGAALDSFLKRSIEMIKK